ncbi:hypothetical protein [Aeromicrobium sp. PE09-221]|uniref:hypothetical protein n=1 Tax=Aeromicrobium sp. PE09-221 TaxID=1898043 RepID=UPI00191C794A|nr:hypothetical protein [Aeromicrobium sp. PE09-221]
MIAQNDDPGIASLLRRLSERGIEYKDLQTKEGSLEEIFVNLVKATADREMNP